MNGRCAGRTALLAVTGLVVVAATPGCVGVSRQSHKLPDHKPIGAQIAAHVDAGRKLWEAACPVQQVGGLCITVEYSRDPAPCADAGMPRLRVVRRDAAAAMQAIRHFGQALALWNNGQVLRESGGGSQAEANRYNAQMIGAVAAAYFLLAEPVLETVLAREPVGFAVGVAADSPGSVEQLRRWVQEMGTAMREPEHYYERLSEELQVGAAERWVAESAARMALLHEHFSDTLMRTPRPADLPAARYDPQAYCDALAALAAPLRDKAAALRERCQTLAAGKWAAQCPSPLLSASATAATRAGPSKRPGLR